ncbi:MAG TPA: DnaJ domain-containing protein [Ktedonobacterales bacterium]|nr:DnaJ domain-containing protein [Ktedonobacterales bacterium]
MMDETADYYGLLGVESGADATEIKAAFKRMALKYHPDVYSGSDAEERMRLLLAAYKTLTNPSKRKTYDLAHGITRRSIWDDEEPLTFSRAANGRGFTASSGRIPTPDKAASNTKPPTASVETDTPSRVTENKVPVTFPRLEAGAGAVIALGGFVYTLTAPQAARLREDGRLLGADMPQRLQHTDGSSAGRRCTCHRCGHSWTVPPDQRRTSSDRCPKCTAPDWAEYLLLRCQECTAVFESQQIRRYDRVQIGERYYGDFHLCTPYELFPKCPNCQVIRWCAGEEMRLNRRGPQPTPSEPAFQATGPRPRVSGDIPHTTGSFPRMTATGYSGGFSQVRPSKGRSDGVPRAFITLVVALLILGSLLAIYAIALAAR